MATVTQVMYKNRYWAKINGEAGSPKFKYNSQIFLRKADEPLILKKIQCKSWFVIR